MTKWRKVTKLQDMLLLENNWLWGGSNDSTSLGATSHHRLLFPYNDHKDHAPKFLFINYTTICLMQPSMPNITFVTHKAHADMTMLSYTPDVSVKPEWAEGFLSDTHVSSFLTHPFHHS